MKPCRKRRKQITWLAIEALDTVQAAELERHLHECIGCRGYFDEIRLVQQRVSSLPSLVSSQGAAELSAVQGREVIRETTSHRRHNYFPRFQFSHQLQWLLALSGSGLAALIFFFTRSEPAHVTAPRPGVLIEISHNPAPPDLLPSFAHYRAVGIQSLDRLDDLLAQQAQKAPHSLPCPTAGTLDLANLPD